MPKYSVQDIVLTKRPGRRAPAPARLEPVERPDRTGPPRHRPPAHHAHHRRERPWWLRPRVIIIAAAAVIIIAAAIPLGNAFGRATVVVTPKSQPVSVNRDFTAGRQGGNLAFQTVELTAKQSTGAAARGTKEVRRKASGTIVVYNAYASRPQRLIKNTRFETPDGKIYRIDQGITIPGYTVSGGRTVPGSVEAVVYADEPGESYNIDRTDFTLPGFKGAPQYTKVYARSKTRMTGGFVGQTYTLAEEDAAVVEKTLKDKLAADFKTQIETTIPKEYILFPDASFIEYGETAIEGEGGTSSSVTVTQEATLVGFLLSREELAKALAQIGVPSYDGLPVKAPNLEELDLAVKNKASLAPRSAEAFTFALSGSTRVVWTYDEEALKEALGGKEKEEFQAVLGGFPPVASAELKTTPFWLGKLPPPERLSVREAQ